MTDGGVMVKSTCLPHTSRQGGSVVSCFSVLVFVSVLNSGDYRRCISAFVHIKNLSKLYYDLLMI